mgnify:CR=1 FL=1
MDLIIMKPLSETYKELGIEFTFPIEIKDAHGNETYFEGSKGFSYKREHDFKGNVTYFEDSDGYWYKREYDANCNVTYTEDSDGYKSGTSRSAKTCEGKVIEVDGIKYKLTAQ